MLAPFPSKQYIHDHTSSIPTLSNGIIQPNLAHPWTSRSALFVPELITEIFKYSTVEDLYTYAAVCLYWEEPAQARLLETVQLDNAVQMRYLRTKPTFRRYVRNLITEIDFDIPIHEFLIPELAFSHFLATRQYTERPMIIKSWQLTGPFPFLPSKFIIAGLHSYSNTLHTFHVHDSLWLDLEMFCDLLNALGNCQKLENLALPTSLLFFHFETPEQRISQCEQAFSQKLITSMNKPRILRLQLVSTNRRNRLCATKPMKDIHAIWIPHPNCPLSFVDTIQLTVGQGADLQRVLPVISKLESLEICCENPSLWTNYSELMKAPLRLPFLKSLWMGFTDMDAVPPFLKIIDTPEIETIKIRYHWIWHHLHSPFFEYKFRNVIQEITKLGVEGSFPNLLKKICIEGSWCTLLPSPVEPPKWFMDVFDAENMTSNNVQLLLEPITIVDPVFMRAHDALD
ncbi:hypothetical protein BDP27DRAFT_1424809 [Rhodocollybia butyracea]|uniref:F-box domain-containing protein n=1 Tax=Rhodocollybia butyracea TaxID=206335 RepID=A0A9P5PNZ8_9AGAR|nr:hypothetical protein BDP27DRAFT_1424809 [Rhodocollybia butyracea]